MGRGEPRKGTGTVGLVPIYLQTDRNERGTNSIPRCPNQDISFNPGVEVGGVGVGSDGNKVRQKVRLH